MGKRVSGTPRRPRNPVARAVRAPLYRQRVEQDKRGRLPDREAVEEQLREAEEPGPSDKGSGKGGADV